MTIRPVSFQVLIHDQYAHIYRLRCFIPTPNKNGQEFSLPSWIPGSYLIREFAKNVIAIKAWTTNKNPLKLHKINKDTWRCEASADAIQIEYDIYAWDLSIRAAFLDQRGGFFNGTSLFVRPHGFENHPYEIEIKAPTLDTQGTWRLATGFTAAQIDEYGFGKYTAQDYDELVDHPVLMGNFREIMFEANGIPHRLIVSGTHHGDLPRVARDLKQLCTTHIQFFGDPIPFKDYTFLLRLEDDAYGGLEHRSSCALLSKRNSLPLENEKEISDNYRTLLGLISHEYFHAWNIKKLKPKSFTPYDYNKENYTDLLWFFEGFTSYYDDLMLLRSQLITPESYLQLLSKSLTSLLQTPGRLQQSLSDSSFDTWIKFYRPDENTMNASVSYYVKGSIAALIFDFSIRQKTKNEKSLDDVMRVLWRQNIKEKDSGIDEEAILKAMEAVCGNSMVDLLNQIVHGTDDFAWSHLFSTFGISCDLTEAKTPHFRHSHAYFGAKLKQEENSQSAQLTHITTNSPAQHAGLSAGDILIAIDNLRVTHHNFESLLARYTPGNTIKIHAFRRGELIVTDLLLQNKPKETCTLTLMKDSVKETIERRQKWFSGK